MTVKSSSIAANPAIASKAALNDFHILIAPLQIPALAGISRPARQDALSGLIARLTARSTRLAFV
jgi:hypothetical protein